MPLPITSVFAAALSLLLVALAFPVVIRRAKLAQSFGDGGDPFLHRAIRSHGNLAEYAPTFLVLLGLLEAGGTAPQRLIGLGVAFLASRALYVAYFYGKQLLPLRIVAFWSTVLPIIVGSVFLLLQAR